MDDIITRHVDMPTAIKGYTCLDENRDYNIYINDRLAPNIRKQVYEHEIAHINNNDFYNPVDVREIEPVHVIPSATTPVKHINVQRSKPISKPKKTKRPQKEYDNWFEDFRREENYLFWLDLITSEIRDDYHD